MAITPSQIDYLAEEAAKKLSRYIEAPKAAYSVIVWLNGDVRELVVWFDSNQFPIPNVPTSVDGFRVSVRPRPTFSSLN